MGQTHTFNYTGTVETFVVPAGAVMLTITADGASGGKSEGLPGGAGARVRADLPVSPGQHIKILVGKRGQNRNLRGGGGGGGTFVDRGQGADFSTPLLVAGGGGGRTYGLPVPGGGGGLALGGSGNGGAAASVSGGGGGATGDGANGSVGAGGLAAANTGAGGLGGGG
ncbi:MAG: hypothetical protein KAI24_05345, partial [Planctomycetes bacterium]|nr:hypothetical protein [Planctomycetota bacterium]